MDSNPTPLQILLLKYICSYIYIKGEERRGEEKEEKKKIEDSEVKERVAKIGQKFCTQSQSHSSVHTVAVA